MADLAWRFSTKGDVPMRPAEGRGMVGCFSVGFLGLLGPWPCGFQEWLQGLFAQHDRAGHTERQALLEARCKTLLASARSRNEKWNEPADSIRGWCSVIPSFPAEHQQV